MTVWESTVTPPKRPPKNSQRGGVPARNRCQAVPSPARPLRREIAIAATRTRPTPKDITAAKSWSELRTARSPLIRDWTATRAPQAIAPSTEMTMTTRDGCWSELVGVTPAILPRAATAGQKVREMNRSPAGERGSDQVGVVLDSSESSGPDRFSGTLSELNP